MQKIDRAALIKSQVAGGTAKNTNSSTATNETNVTINIGG